MVYDYHFGTPVAKQWNDFKNDVTSIESWEKKHRFWSNYVCRRIWGCILFRLDRHLHLKSPDIPLWHYHYRWTIDGITKGGNAPRSISIPLKKP